MVIGAHNDSIVIYRRYRMNIGSSNCEPALLVVASIGTLLGNRRSRLRDQQPLSRLLDNISSLHYDTLAPIRDAVSRYICSASPRLEPSSAVDRVCIGYGLH